MVTGQGIFTSGSLLPTHHDRDIKFLSAGRRKCEMSRHSRADALGSPLTSGRRNAGVLERRWTGTEVSDWRDGPGTSTGPLAWDGLWERRVGPQGKKKEQGRRPGGSGLLHFALAFLKHLCISRKEGLFHIVQEAPGGCGRAFGAVAAPRLPHGLWLREHDQFLTFL